MTDEPRAEIAQAALDRHEWRQAYDALAAADDRGELSPHELELLAQSAWWLGMLPAAIDARERAYAAATRTGDLNAAVSAAIELGRDNLFRNALSVGEAWLNRAARLLEGVEENLGHGWLAADARVPRFAGRGRGTVTWPKPRPRRRSASASVTPISNSSRSARRAPRSSRWGASTRASP